MLWHGRERGVKGDVKVFGLSHSKDGLAVYYKWRRTVGWAGLGEKDRGFV